MSWRMALPGSGHIALLGLEQATHTMETIDDSSSDAAPTEIDDDGDENLDDPGEVLCPGSDAAPLKWAEGDAAVAEAGGAPEATEAFGAESLVGADGTRSAQAVAESPKASACPRSSAVSRRSHDPGWRPLALFESALALRTPQKGTRKSRARSSEAADSLKVRVWTPRFAPRETGSNHQNSDTPMPAEKVRKVGDSTAIQSPLKSALTLERKQPSSGDSEKPGEYLGEQSGCDASVRVLSGSQLWSLHSP